jgi:hypothetical protein
VRDVNHADRALIMPILTAARSLSPIRLEREPAGCCRVEISDSGRKSTALSWCWSSRRLQDCISMRKLFGVLTLMLLFAAVSGCSKCDVPTWGWGQGAHSCHGSPPPS